MIVHPAELRTLLGLASSITDEERAVLNLIHPPAESKVKAYLGYDPEQRAGTEYYPRTDVTGSVQEAGVWDVNAARTRAFLERSGDYSDTLQLERVPLRSVAEVLEDTSARYGQASGAFASGSALVSGEDYWIEWDEDDLCRSGCLIRNGAWPLERGTVRVNYRAGYSPDELAGRATADGTDSVGNITTNGVDASGIKRAIYLTAVKSLNTWAMNKKKTRVGFTGGPLQSERLGDYSYTLGGGVTTELAGMLVSLPPEAEDELEAFVNWGVLRT